MNCTWCEEEGELIDYCDIEGHRVCKACYEKYKTNYPLRVEGCPYCKGNEEKVVVYIHSIHLKFLLYLLLLKNHGPLLEQE